VKEWLDKTCQDCIYRDNNICRKNPPSSNQYPVVVYLNLVGEVDLNAEYKMACSCWKKDEK